MANDQNSEVLLKLKAIDELTPVMVKALQSMEANSAKMASALDKVSESTHKTQENTEGLHGGLVSLDAGLELAEKGIELVHYAFEALEQRIDKAIETSLEAEKAQTRLTGALVSTGKYTGELNDELSEYAEHLQKTTGVSAETVKGILATGLQMGLTTEKAQQLVSASQKLAAATGTDVESAFQKLQGSLAGHGRALAMNVAGVSDLSAAQLKNGAAIDLVNQQLTAQFQIYQGSFSAGLARAHEGVEDIYKTFGNLITQNPAVKEALNQFAIVLGDINGFADKNRMTMKAWVSDGVLLLIDSLEGVNVTFDAVERGGVIAFKSVEGAVEGFGLGLVTLVDGPFALLYKALSYLPGEQGKQFQAAADEIGTHMAEMAGDVNKSTQAIEDAMAGPTKTSQALTDNILKVREAVQGAIATEGQHKKALEDTNESMSKHNAETLKLQQTYAGFITYGNAAIREGLAHEVSDRDTDLKHFQEYLEAKERLAVSMAEEQQMAVNAIASKALKGTGGSTEASASAQVEIDNETKKQAALAQDRQKGVLNYQQYQATLLASEQRAQSAQLNMDQAFAKAQADLLGNSPEGFAKKQQIANQQFQMQLQQRKLRAKQEGMSESQIDQMAEQANKEHLAQMEKDEISHYNSQAEMNTLLGDNTQAYFDRVHAAQVTQGTVMGALTATTNSAQYKAMSQSFGNLASLMNTHSRSLFNIGKQAAVAQTIMNTASAMIAALAPPPLGVGPLFGGILAGTTAAMGAVQIAQIESQSFPGGQAHGGIDEIPSNLNNKTFLLAGGERVLQPQANKDLTGFLDKQKSGGSAGGGNTYITLNYSGSMSKDDVENMSEMLIKKIRSESNKGRPIISSKGLTD